MRTAPETTWHPLFSPAGSRPFRDAVDAVAEDLARPLHAPVRYRPWESPADGRVLPAGDLACGKAGPALLFAYRYLAGGSGRDKANAVRLLNEAITETIAAPFAAPFFGGWTGVAWAAAHACRLAGWRVAGDPVAAVDALVRAATEDMGTAGPAALADGLVGLGVFAHERLPRPAAVACLGRVVALLTARGAAGGDVPGLAHGTAGVVALLATAVGDGVPGADRALARAVPALLERDLSVAAIGLGWSDGAPGVAAALLQAAHRADRPDWARAAVDVAVRACETPLDRCDVADHGLAHGAAGVAHLFHRLHRATGHEGLREGARTWFRRLLDMRHPRDGVGGFLAHHPRRGSGDPWVADPGLLHGAAGTALAMLAACSPVSPAWDRALLADVPPAPWFS